MKKLFLLILILASNIFGQGWNQIVTTDINEPHKTDIFTNSSAIHILILNNAGNIVYYNFNSEGIVCTTKTCTLETSGSFPNIVGTNDKIFAIYKTGNNIRVKYSTDNGDSWLTSIDDIQTTPDKDCNGVDAVYQEGLSGGVHLVWATQDNTNPVAYETYYYLLNTDYSWVNPKTVTDDGTAQYGGNPNVVVSPNRVHVSFNTDPTTNDYGLGDVKTRDKYNGNWQTPQTVVSVSSDQYQSMDERLLVRGDYLYLFYSRENPQTYPQDLRFRTRRADDTQGWSGFTQLEEGTLFQHEDAFEITKTTNNYIHILYKKYDNGWRYTYKYYNGTNWITTADFYDQVSTALRQIGLSSVSNDLFCTWVKWQTPTRYLSFRQYDAIPLAPTGLTIREDANNHPRLDWNVSPEPDRNHYNIYRYDSYGGGWQYLTQTTDISYTDVSLTYCHAIPPAQCQNIRNFYYRITVVDEGVDEGSLESNPSNEVQARLVGGPPSKAGVNDSDLNTVFEYSLGQNYPNPFNPSTKISYSIKEEGLVTLKVYDVLGIEVATLINESKPSGNYEVEFNASSLPSGMYIYKIQSGRYISTKKMIVIK